jgi:hypothetical protein
MHTFDPLCVSNDLPGVNPTTLNRMILYYRLMTKWSGLADSTELSRMGLSQAHNLVSQRRQQRRWSGGTSRPVASATGVRQG